MDELFRQSREWSAGDWASMFDDFAKRVGRMPRTYRDDLRVRSAVSRLLGELAKI